MRRGQLKGQKNMGELKEIDSASSFGRMLQCYMGVKVHLQA